MENPTDFLKLLKEVADIGICVPIGVLVRYLVNWLKRDACLSSRCTWWLIMCLSMLLALAATFMLPEIKSDVFKSYVWWVMLCKTLFNGAVVIAVAVAAHQYLKPQQPTDTPAATTPPAKPNPGP